MLLAPENNSKEPSKKSQNRPDFCHSKKVIIAHSKVRPHNRRKHKHSLGHKPALCQECLPNNKTQKAMMYLSAVLWRTQTLKNIKEFFINYIMYIAKCHKTF